MSEFDLRPFEVKKKYEERFVLWKVNVMGITKKEERINSFESSARAWTWVRDNFIGSIKSYQTYEHPIYYSYFIRRETGAKEWTFEDIQVGWFFKTSINYVYIKISERKGRCIQNSGNEFYVSDLIFDFEVLDGKITNVYDCPELAKVLMIERIVTWP